MLPKHLIAKTDPIANPDNIVFWKDYRITILKERLFRVEKDDKKLFNDYATQSVWFRRTPKISFQVQNGTDFIEITTQHCMLHIEDDIENAHVLLEHQRVKLDNAENLQGTCRTLDGDFGNRNAETLEVIPLDTGVCSKNGVAVLDDLTSLRLTKEGTLMESAPQQIDCYVFAFGKDYRGAVKALYDITGYPPLIPRYALGNWWSRYHDYTDKEYLRVLRSFEKRNIPFTVETIDMDWHYSNDLDEQQQITASGKNTPFYGGNVGWTGYSWNTKLFPDYKAFLRELKEKNYKITLNLHPADGIRWFEDSYETFAKAMSIDPTTQQQIAFDITNDCFINAYFRILHNPYEDDGVDFWWIDWQQGTTSNTPGLDPLWALNHYHFLDNAQKHLPLILSRYCKVGAHRYPLGFSGDTYIVWESLDYLPYFTANASNIGFTWWSHDIGGHLVGIKDDELYLRYVQYGVFSPINRLHCTQWNVLNKDTSVYKNGKGLIAEEFLRLRHRLIPYLYSANYRTHEDGIPLIEPLYYHNPNDERAYAYPNEYYFGEQLLVTPITKPSDNNGIVRCKIYLPQGRWTDIFTGDTYTGDCEKEIVRWQDTYPVFAKDGAIIVTSGDEGNSVNNPQLLYVDVYNGNGNFRLVEDTDGTNVFFTQFQTTEKKGRQTLFFTFSGAVATAPTNRTLVVSFKNLPNGDIIVRKTAR